MTRTPNLKTKMKLLIPILLLFTSCVATTNDLASMAGDMQGTLEALSAKVEANQAAGLGSSEAFAQAAGELSQAVEGTVEAIEGRVTEVTATVAALGEKASEGPAGWLEILGTIGGVVLAGGAGMNAHRNKTRQAGKYLGPGDTVPPQAGK